MYNNQKFYVVTEANVGANDVINMANYTFVGEENEGAAYSKLYRLWGYGANPEQGETRQLLSATLTEYSGDRAILKEAKVFDYRQPEPAPVPEWIQPGEDDPGYMIGDVVMHNEMKWISTVDNNKYEPGVEGWDVVTE